MEFLQLLPIHATRGIGHEARRLLCLGVRDHVADRGRAAHEHDEAIEPKRDPAVRRRAELQGL